MGKKGVPEWLNSSMWSSGPSSTNTTDDPRLAHYTAKLLPEAPKAERAPVRPASPPPPPLVPPATQQLPQPVAPPRSDPLAESPKAEIKDGGHDPSPSRFSPEEVSRQSQLLAELSRKVVNLVELRRLATQGIPDGAGIRPTVWRV